MRQYFLKKNTAHTINIYLSVYITESVNLDDGDAA